MIGPRELSVNSFLPTRAYRNRRTLSESSAIRTLTLASRISPYSYPSRKKLNGGFSTARVLLWAVKIRGSPGG